MEIQNYGVTHFVGLVATMRMHQRDYFRTRDVCSLNQARRLEREVDLAVTRIQHGTVQLSLLPEEQA